MAPKGWTTDAQAAFLTEYLSLYDKYALNRRYQPFWDTINAKYLRRFPILPEGVSAEGLSEEEHQAYSEKLSKLYSRIKDWYRWRRNGRSRNTTHTVTSKQMREIYTAGTRTGKEYEVYVKMYPDVFQPAYDAECARLSANGRAKLTVWHRIAKEVWENASDEEKAAVQAQLILDREASTAEEEDPCTPDDYQKYVILSIPILNSTQLLLRKAGVLAFITIVGPVPNAGGQILATTLQFGDKYETPLFSNTWTDHDRVLVDRLANFAARYEFSPDVCAKRSLAQKAEEAAEGLDTPGDAATVCDVSEGSGSASGDVSSPPEVTIPSTNDPPQTEEISTKSFLPIAEGTVNTDSSLNILGCSGEWWQNTNWADPEVLESIRRLNAPDVNNDGMFPPTVPSDQLDNFPHLPGSTSLPNHEHFNTNSLVISPTVSTPVLHQSASFDVANPSTSGSVTVTTPLLPAHAPATLHATIPAKDTPGTTPTTLQAPELGALATAPSNLFTSVQGFDISTPSAFVPRWPPVNPKSGNGKSKSMRKEPTKENVSPSATKSSGNNAPAGGPNGARATRAPLQDLPGNGTLAEGPNAVRPTPPFRDASTHGTPPTHTPLRDVDDTVRRSSRAPVPSTRLDRQNEIGTNIVPLKPPVDAASIIEEPSWFAPAYDHLKNNALGPLWTDLVEKWAEYERAKGWKSAKGLPAKGRPEEWQQWISKARWGIRDYNHVPSIGDAADLGLAVTKWVSSFNTPDFGKTGPHGMVALLTLMVWWGTAALTPSSWNSDSRPQWRRLVQDLFDRFNILLNELSVLKWSGDTDNSDEAPKSKRPRMEPIDL
ncbi:hypothetical protein H1R20_g9638, partial [Candolleomyces eurysporus]